MEFNIISYIYFDIKTNETQVGLKCILIHVRDVHVAMRKDVVV